MLSLAGRLYRRQSNVWSDPIIFYLISSLLWLSSALCPQWDLATCRMIGPTVELPQEARGACWEFMSNHVYNVIHSCAIAIWKWCGLRNVEYYCLLTLLGLNMCVNTRHALLFVRILWTKRRTYPYIYQLNFAILIRPCIFQREWIPHRINTSPSFNGNLDYIVDVFLC